MKLKLLLLAVSVVLTVSVIVSGIRSMIGDFKKGKGESWGK